MGEFKLVSQYQPKGDQPQAIEALTQGFSKGLKAQTLLGVTGSGKTFTMASVIEKVQRPTLVIAHNKTLAAQLCGEFRAFFPDSTVEYLSATMIIISRRRILPPAIPILRRTRPSMMRSTVCATRPRRRCANGGM